VVAHLFRGCAFELPDMCVLRRAPCEYLKRARLEVFFLWRASELPGICELTDFKLDLLLAAISTMQPTLLTSSLCEV
jgi:hypothetical protein